MGPQPGARGAAESGRWRSRGVGVWEQHNCPAPFCGRRGRKAAPAGWQELQPAPSGQQAPALPPRLQGPECK